MTENHGGARPGAGRKPKAEQFPEVFDHVDQRLAGGALERLDALELAAAIGTETVHETWEPAGTVIVEDLMTDAESGKVLRVKRLAFPDLPVDKMVLVRQKVVRNGPSESANMYLLDRLLGKPMQATELSGPNGAPIETVGLTLDEWKAQAAQRLAEANATLAQLDADDHA